MKFEHTSVYNFDNAFRGMRNALESWKKSDSNWNTVDNCIFPEHPDGCAACPAFHGFGYPCFQIGENLLPAAHHHPLRSPAPRCSSLDRCFDVR